MSKTKQKITPGFPRLKKNGAGIAAQRRRRAAPDRMRVGSRRLARPPAAPATINDWQDRLSPREFHANQIDLLDLDFDEVNFDASTLLSGGDRFVAPRRFGAADDDSDLW